MARRELRIVQRLSAVGVLLLLPASIFSSNSPSLAKLKAIERRFVDDVRIAGIKTVIPPPAIRTETTAILATYNPKENAIHVLRWNSAPLPAKATFNLMAIYCKDGVTGEKLFTESYSRLFFAHELGHWLQLQFHHGPADQYGLETEANRIAVAFWSTRADDRAWLARMVECYKEVRTQFPNPTPKGEDPRGHFNRNWMKWVEEGKLEYGAYQIRMIIDAWEERDRLPFAQLVQSVSRTE